MNITLVTVHAYPSPQAVPLAAGYLASYLLGNSDVFTPSDIVLVDLFLDDPADAAISAILAAQPHYVGFSIYVWNREKCGELATTLRKAAPDVTLFAGGPEPTANPAGILSDAPYDFVICGEGEAPFFEAMDRLPKGQSLEGIPGTAVTIGRDVAVYPPAEPVPLSSIPSPYLAGCLDVHRLPGVLWQLSRGCGFACDFCFDHRSRRGVRRFPMERIRAELELFARSGVTQVFVLASTFNHDLVFAKDVLRHIIRMAPHIHFHFEIRSEFLDREMAQLFAQANCSLQIGLQSAHRKVLSNVGRSFDRENFREKISLLNEFGAIFGFDLIYGLPGDSLAGFAASMDFALSLYPNHLDIFPLAVLPGTALHGKATEFSLDYLSSPPYTITGSPTFPPEDMSEAGDLAAACDIYYSRGKAVAWFNCVVAPLRMAPSVFIRHFALWLAATTHRDHFVEQQFDDTEIHRMQRDFLRHIYRERETTDLLAAALDLVDYHFHYAAALLASPPDLPTDRELEKTDLLAHPLHVSDSTRLATFSYEIIDILEAGDIDLKDFSECFSPSGSCAAIYPRGGDVYTESLDPRYFSLLKQLDGTRPAAHLIPELGLAPEETASFLEFAAAEGIICLAPS